ncbi:MAG: PAS domain-containing protein [Candidatus Sulfotelmatobacter sp.]|jgi:PAS domain S-box-containing protein
MLQFLIILALSIALVAVLGGWRRDRRLLSESRKGSQDRDVERTAALEKANEDLKAFQADLQRRWQYLAEAQRLSHSGTFGWKVHTGELVWSDETYRILGFARETHPTLDLVFDRVHPEDRDRLQQLRDRATRNGMDLDIEHRVVLPDGVIRHVHVVAHAGRDNSGNLEYVGVITDITERKRADEEREALSRSLQESKARLEEAQSVAHVGYWDWDLETGQIIWSDETYRIFGFKPQQRPMDIEMVSGLVHPDDREALYSTVDEEVAVGVHPVHQHRIVRPSGEVRTVQSITSKLWKTTHVGTEDGIPREHNRLFGTVQDITELKQAEEASHALSRDLQESKDWLEEAQRVTHVGYWVWDLVTNRLIVSDEYCHILGLTPKNGPIDLATVSEIIHPEDREYVFRTAEEAVRSGERADCEHRILRPNGELRVVHSLGDLKKDSSGRPYQMFGTTQDITDRKRGEEALRRSQFYLSEGQRLAHMGSWAFNDSGHYWSDELYKIYGLDPQNGAPTVEQYLALVHPQDRASMAETIKRMQEEHCGFDQIERIIRPDGQLRYVRAVAVPVLEQGVFKGFVGTTMDVTEQELLTQELRREQAYFTDAQRMAHIGSWVYNLLTQKLLHSSDENTRLYGFDPSQGPMSAKRFFDTQHAEDAPLVNATLERAVREGTDFYLDEYRIHHTDGSIRFLRAIGHRNASGEPGEYVGVTMDITKQKHAEEERERLRRLEADLAHINRVNMMGELAAALAHEIKQPIAAAVANAGACLGFLEGERPDIAEAREAASGTIGCGRRAAEIIDHVRSLFKKSFPQREPVDINELIREIALLLENDIRHNSVTLRLELAENLPEVAGDRVQLEQVLMNLMLNAIEAMCDANGDLTITSKPTDDGHSLISVSDTGVGIPADKVDQIFDTFFTTKPQGTGMGLAISRSIVESHGGRLWATSSSGRGSTFRFTLPHKV